MSYYPGDTVTYSGLFLNSSAVVSVSAAQWEAHGMRFPKWWVFESYNGLTYFIANEWYPNGFFVTGLVYGLYNELLSATITIPGNILTGEYSKQNPSAGIGRGVGYSDISYTTLSVEVIDRQTQYSGYDTPVTVWYGKWHAIFGINVIEKSPAPDDPPPPPDDDGGGGGDDPREAEAQTIAYDILPTGRRLRAYSDKTNGSFKIGTAKSYAGGQWEDVTPGITAFLPSITVDEDGKIWLVYSTSIQDDAEIHIRSSEDEGRTWSAAVAIVPRGTHPKVRRITGGRRILTYIDSGNVYIRLLDPLNELEMGPFKVIGAAKDADSDAIILSGGEVQFETLVRTDTDALRLYTGSITSGTNITFTEVTT